MPINNRVINLFTLAFCLLLTNVFFDTVKASEQSVVPFLERPYHLEDVSSIISYFDHDSPTYNSDPHEAIVIFTGQKFGDGRIASCSLGLSCYSGHNGIDYDTPNNIGKDILSAAKGTVIKVENNITATATTGGCDSNEYGNYVLIEHKFPGHIFRTRYAHLEHASVIVTEGQEVEAGVLLGKSGTTGCSSGDHLHFDVQHKPENGDFAIVDPYGWWGENVDPWKHSSYYLWKSSDTVDNHDNGFQFFNTARLSWEKRNNTTAYNEEALVTRAVHNPANYWDKWAFWVPEFTEAGIYKVQVHIPKLEASEANEYTSSAKYRVVSIRTDAQTGVKERITMIKTLNHAELSQKESNERWFDLEGQYECQRYNSCAVILVDETDNESDNLKYIWADAIRWVPVHDLSSELYSINNCDSSNASCEPPIGVDEEATINLKVRNTGSVTWTNDLNNENPEEGVYYTDLRSVSEDGSLVDSFLSHPSWQKAPRIVGSMQEAYVGPGGTANFSFVAYYPPISPRIPEIYFDLYFPTLQSFSSPINPIYITIEGPAQQTTDTETGAAPEEEAIYEIEVKDESFTREAPLSTNGISFDQYRISAKEGTTAPFSISFQYDDGTIVKPNSSEVQWLINGEYQEEIDTSVWGSVSSTSSDGDFIYHAPSKMPPSVALILGIPKGMVKNDFTNYPYILWASTLPKRSFFSPSQHEFAKGPILNSSVTDFNNDGFDDLFVSKSYLYPRHEAYINTHGLNGGKAFISELLDNDKPGYAILADYNHDNFIDIWYSKYRAGSVALANQGVENNQLSFEISSSFDPAYFYKKSFRYYSDALDTNNDMKSFADFDNDSKLEALPAAEDYFSSVADFNNDGFLDAFTNGRLLVNENGTMQDAQQLIDDAGDIKDRGGVVWADLNNDGFLDMLYINRYLPSHIYLNNGGESFTHLDHHISEAHDALILDYNNDNLLDIVIASGHSAFTKLCLNRGIINGNPEFEEINDLRVSFGGVEHNQIQGLHLSSLDNENDGDIDILVADSDTSGSSRLLINNSNSSNHIVLRIYGKPNIFGTQVRLFNAQTNEFIALRQIDAAYNGSQNSQLIHFAVPDINAKYYAEIRYPGAEAKLTNELNAGEIYFISYGSEDMASNTMPEKPIIHFSESSLPELYEGKEIKIPFSVLSDTAVNLEILSTDSYTKIEEINNPELFNLVYAPTRDTVSKPNYRKDINLLIKASNAFGASSLSNKTISVVDDYANGDFEHYNAKLYHHYRGEVQDFVFTKDDQILFINSDGLWLLDHEGSTKLLTSDVPKAIKVDEQGIIHAITGDKSYYWYRSQRYTSYDYRYLQKYKLENNQLTTLERYDIPFDSIDNFAVSNDGLTYYLVPYSRSIYTFYPETNNYYERYNCKHLASKCNLRHLEIAPDANLWAMNTSSGSIFEVGGNYRTNIKPKALPNAFAINPEGEIIFSESYRTAHELKWWKGYGQQLEKLAGIGSGTGRDFSDGDYAMDKRLYINKVQVNSQGEIYFLNNTGINKLVSK